ncbi:MFS transporter [Oxalicibacterium flavum]|uniref:MFS transporter n=1 Tax=Oxalicibacterium flavum TaxID=179467 RepID=A0A8J2UL93_9BURK|nr:MFS transporter [Oxalicibacterium flavum]GGB98497.1 MFS transporter [Oxalicibacterium flavum]
MSSVVIPAPSRLTRIAAPFLFILLGVIYASWAARIPAIRDNLTLDPAQLGFVLLGAGIGAVTSFPLAAWMVDRFGGPRAAWYAGLGLLLTLPCLALAPSLFWLIAAAFCLGAGSGCFDVAINAIGTEQERLAGRSTMSLLHAWFCVGTLSGALLGAAMAGMGITVAVHFSLIAIAMLPLLYLCAHSLPSMRAERDPTRKLFAVAHGPLVMLGIIGFCGAVAEGSIADWSGVFMTDRLHVHDGVAPLAFAGFACLMLLARLVCDRFKDRFGARRVVASGALLAAAGLVIALLAVNVPVTIAGFALAGAGLAAVFPFVFSAAGRHGSTALAAVATFSYSGGLIGPPVIGFFAHHWGLSFGLCFVSVLAIGIAIAASRARWLE